MILLKEYIKNHPTNDINWDNCTILLSKINIIRYLYNKPMYVTSGYRPEAYNVKIGGSKSSAHIDCLAIDIKDDGFIKNWIKKNIPLIERLGFYFEDFAYTAEWVHFTIRKPNSGKRFFIP